MKEKSPDYIEELMKEMFIEAMKKVSKKDGEKYKFIVKAGYSLHNAIFELYS